MSNLVPTKRIDCIGLFCPMPIVKTRDAMKGMAAGELLEMVVDDPGSDPDMRSWTQRTGNELVRVEKNDGIYRFLIRKLK